MPSVADREPITEVQGILPVPPVDSYPVASLNFIWFTDEKLDASSAPVRPDHCVCFCFLLSFIITKRWQIFKPFVTAILLK